MHGEVYVMPGEVKMSLSIEALDSGSAEERATFGLFSMTANVRLLTEGLTRRRDEESVVRIEWARMCRG